MRRLHAILPRRRLPAPWTDPRNFGSWFVGTYRPGRGGSRAGRAFDGGDAAAEIGVDDRGSVRTASGAACGDDVAVGHRDDAVGQIP